jgi:lysophospholipase
MQTNLARTQDNQPPPRASSGLVQTPDGVPIRYACWKTRSPAAKGTVLLAQGRTEYIEKYFETATDLLQAGFDVCTFDWRGQGGSGRALRDPRRGFVDSFDQYVMDLETVLDQVVLPDCRPPYAILAHSTGGLVSLIAAPLIATRIQRMVLSSPLIQFGTVPFGQRAMRCFSGALTLAGMGQVYLSGGPDVVVSRGFEDNVLTSDEDRFARNHAFAKNRPDLVIGGPTAAWLYAACRAMDMLVDPDFIGTIRVPTLLIAAGRDKVVSNAAIERLGYAMRSGATVVIDGARHEILQERDIYRQQFLAAFDAFFPGGQ